MWPSVRIFILPSGTDRHGRLPPGVGNCQGLSVRIARAFTAGNAPAAALARRGRAAYLDPPDRSVAELGVEPLDEHRGEQPDLGSPGGRVRGDRQLAVGEAVRLG